MPFFMNSISSIAVIFPSRVGSRNGRLQRRLRMQRGLRREDFEPNVAATTIARIEQGLVRRLQKETSNSIANRLQVKVDEIETY